VFKQFQYRRQADLKIGINLCLKHNLFLYRILLPWKGYREKELEEQSGIDGAIFVHISGFIGGVKTKEGALKMAEKTLEQ